MTNSALATRMATAIGNLNEQIGRLGVTANVTNVKAKDAAHRHLLTLEQIVHALTYATVQKQPAKSDTPTIPLSKVESVLKETKGIGAARVKAVMESLNS